jgi:hypothetical protein
MNTNYLMTYLGQRRFATRLQAFSPASPTEAVFTGIFLTF